MTTHPQTRLYDINPTAAKQARNAGIDEAHQLAERLRTEAEDIATEHEVPYLPVFHALSVAMIETIQANHPAVR